MKRKIISVLLCGLITSLLPILAFAEMTDSGECGTSLTWEIDSDGTLTISGTGEMDNYTYLNDNTTTAPWGKHSGSIKAVVIENGVTSIGQRAFLKCSKITSVTIPDTITHIGIHAFEECRSLESVTIPDGVTSIYSDTFYGCSSLTSVTIGNGVTSIGGNAFYGCDSLPNLVIPDSVTSVGSCAFSGCSNLQTVTIGNSVTSIGSSAFYNCSRLTSVTMPDGVTSIGVDAFYGCSSLMSVVIPDSVMSIGNWTFDGCIKLAHVAFTGTKDAWDSISKGEGVFSTSPTIHYNCTSLDGHYIPVERKDPSCTSTGYIKYGCSCGYEFTETLPIEHVYVYMGYYTPTCVEHGHDLYKCSKCGTENKKYKNDELVPHEYVATVVEPTCLKGGYTLHKCAVCGDEYNDTLTALLGHSMVSVSEKAPTCTEAGHTAGVQCFRCGVTDSGITEIPALGHNFGDWSVTTEPTCTEKGEEIRNCSRCDASETKVVYALGHDFVYHAGKSATCTEKGWAAYDTCNRCDYTTYEEIPATGHYYDTVVTAPNCTGKGYTVHTCADCGDYYIDSYTDALGHEYGEWEHTKVPTCTASGRDTRKCSRCSATETRYVSIIDHDRIHHESKAATCTEKGWEAYDTCSRCDYTTYKGIPATGHYRNAVVTVPTCMEKGYTTHICANCGDSYVDNYTDALDHSYGEWTQTKAPTCIASGSEIRGCTRCNATEMRYVAALGHDIAHHAAKPATCTEIGWIVYDTCNRCDYTTYKESPAMGHHRNTVVTAPTCTEKGHTTHICVDCGDIYVDSYTDTLGHDYKDGVCTRCGAADPKYIAAPALKITTVSGHPKIYWNSVDGAYKYWIYRSTDGKNFKYYDRTSKTSYTNNATNVGTLYYYKVKAVKAVDGKDVASVYSNTRSIRCKPAAPKLTLTRSAGKPKLSWNSVKGADKYWIYRSTDGTNYKYYDSTTKTTYTNNSTTIAQRYWYKVKAVKVVNGNNYASVYSNSDFVWVSTKAPTLKITTYKGDPKITWNSVSGAKLYWVFVSTDGKTYYFLNETKNTSYIDKNVKAGKKYYYKVQAVALYNGTFAIPSAYSYPVSITAK